MKKHYTYYYASLIVVSFICVAYTVLVGSNHVTFGSKVQRLVAQQLELQEQRNQLQTKIAHAVASQSVKEYAQAQGFETIASVTVVDTGTLVAVR